MSKFSVHILYEGQHHRSKLTTLVVEQIWFDNGIVHIAGKTQRTRISKLFSAAEIKKVVDVRTHRESNDPQAFLQELAAMYRISLSTSRPLRDCNEVMEELDLVNARKSARLGSGGLSGNL